MKQEITYKQLLDLDHDIDHQMQTSPAFAMFNKEKVLAFYRNNNLALQTIKTNLRNLLYEHIESDEKGQLSYIPKADGSKEFVWKRPSSKAAYDAACNELLSRSVTIHI